VEFRIATELDSLQKELRFIARLDVMDDIITRDIDRRIAGILAAKKEDLALIGEIYVTDMAGRIVSASAFERVGQPFEEPYRFAADITASFDGQPIGRLYLTYGLENLKKHLISDNAQSIYFFDTAAHAPLMQNAVFPDAITFSRPIPQLGSTEVRLDLNPAEVLSVFAELRSIILLGTAAGILLIIAVSAYFASRITRPVSRLSEVADDISTTGDYTKRVEVYSDDEIGRLSRAFNAMIQSVEDALNRLKEESQNRIRLQEEKSKNEMLESLSKQLSKYLSPQIYNQIFEKKINATLESRRKKLTVFFSDIVGFTDTTEKMEAEDLSTILNHYLNEMSTIALEFGGTVDKFIGDAIMIFFGDPETKGVKEDARLCIAMALKMIRRMHELEAEWYKMGVTHPFKIRIGIHTGFSTVGNFGSENRMDYTIIGGTINLASRLESISGENEITISEETMLLISDTFVCQEIDAIKVKGFQNPVKIYKVLGERGKTPLLQEAFDGFALSIDPDQADREKSIAALRAVLQKLQ
jgi:class 3 adenylate cyclase/HAMP domain-containing protein